MSVQEPFWDPVFKGLGEDVRDLVHACFVEFSSSGVNINLGNFADEDGESSTDSGNNSECEWDLVASIDVSVLHTEDVSERGSVFKDNGRLKRKGKVRQAHKRAYCPHIRLKHGQ